MTALLFTLLFTAPVPPDPTPRVPAARVVAHVVGRERGRRGGVVVLGAR